MDIEENPIIQNEQNQSTGRSMKNLGETWSCFIIVGTWHGTRDTNTSLCKSSLNRGRNNVHAAAIESWLTTDIPRVFSFESIDSLSSRSMHDHQCVFYRSIQHVLISHYLTIIEIARSSYKINPDHQWSIMNIHDSFLTEFFWVNKLKMLWRDRLVDRECDI